jgi:lysophospholipid acyltransferase (LPLAT)-like uncharacterized protein
MKPSWKSWYRVDTVPMRWWPVYVPISYILAALLWSYIRLVRWTCRFTVVGEEHLEIKRFVWVLWHEHVWLNWVSLGDWRGHGWLNHPYWYMRPIHLAASWDGVEMLYLGSSGSGGRAALEALIAGVRRGQNTVVMPDGPAGPRRQARPGAVLTGAVTGLPLVPLRFEAKRCWNLGGWDEKQLPIPFVSHWELTVGPPITVVPGKEAEATSALVKALNGDV